MADLVAFLEGQPVHNGRFRDIVKISMINYYLLSGDPAVLGDRRVAESEAFRKAISQKQASDAAKQSKVDGANVMLRELFAELSQMSRDLRKHGVGFEWGQTKWRSQEKAIILTKEGGSWSGSNAIVVHSGHFYAYGGHGTNAWNEQTHEYEETYHDAKLGSTATEAAETIAKSLVADDKLPALGRHTEVGWYVTPYQAQSESVTNFAGTAFLGLFLGALAAGVLAVAFPTLAVAAMIFGADVNWPSIWQIDPWISVIGGILAFVGFMRGEFGHNWGL